MIIELGHFALILAFCLTLVQAFFGFAGAQMRRTHWMAVTTQAVAGQFVLTLLAFACLSYSFYKNDFSVLYVANHSNLELPTIYRFTAVWGAHEGSLLLWSLVLSLWTIAVAAFTRHVPQLTVSRVLAVLGVISAGFASFLLLTSSPFERLLNPPADGRELNPLLQDFGLAIHPPMLYIGYVGFAVPFAFAVAAMMEGKLESIWARWVRPWAVMAWVFLTCGIALGSWWAYYELGWGGWWFWDAVENASFMPWLLGTALIHSLAVTEKRGLFKGWTLLLAIGSFSLSLLGTFLVRSGIIESVHAFASDPSRGLYILVFLGLCVGVALALYAWRAPLFRSNVGFSLVSRESFLLVNNLLLVVATLVVLIGTLHPVLLDALKMDKSSVGEPYFNAVFPIPMLPLVFLLAVGMHAGWKHASFDRTKKLLLVLLAVAVVLGTAIPIMMKGWHSLLSVVAYVAGGWVLLSALIEPVQRWRNGHSLSAGMVGMCVAHLGLALFVFGVASVQSYGQSRDLSLRTGQSAQVGGYDFKLDALRDVTGPNYQALEGEFTISRDGETLTTITSQKRRYRSQSDPLTEAGIDANLSHDLVVSMGNDLGNETWSLRLQYKPMIRFIWLGAAVMALGGLVSVADRRYRQRVTSEAPSTVSTEAKPA
jgi:cytochrome c-type biogenesis protein CcmF